MTTVLEKMIVFRQHVYDLLGRVLKSGWDQEFPEQKLSSVSWHVITRKLSGHVITENYPAFPGMLSLEKLKYFSSSTISSILLSITSRRSFRHRFGIISSCFSL